MKDKQCSWLKYKWVTLKTCHSWLAFIKNPPILFWHGTLSHYRRPKASPPEPNWFVPSSVFMQLCRIQIHTAAHSSTPVTCTLSKQSNELLVHNIFIHLTPSALSWIMKWEAWQLWNVLKRKKERKYKLSLGGYIINNIQMHAKQKTLLTYSVYYILR